MRRWLTALASGVLAAALPAIVQAAFLWTLVVTPVTVTQGQSKVFSFTATNQDILSRLGCLEVDLPTSFVTTSIGTPVASNGDPWVSSLSGNSVVVQSTSGGGRLRTTDTVTFSITAVPTAGGAFLWTTHAHTRQDCNGTDQIGASLAVIVMPAPTPTPIVTPMPTPTPPRTPAPIATPSPLATPAATQKPRPTGTPASTPTAGDGVPVDESPTPRSGDPSPTPDASDGVRPSPPAPGGSGNGDAAALRLAPFNDPAGGVSNDLGIGLEAMGQLDGAFVWFVPGAAVGVPGLLVILFVVAQAIGALAWIPAVRRMGGDDRRRPGVSPGR